MTTRLPLAPTTPGPGLSVACHHHAFELAPTATEVHHLISLVGTVVDAAPPPQYGR
jgi:hypothetical protein